MKIAEREVLLCSCGGTMPLDAVEIAQRAHDIGLVDGLDAPRIHTALCRQEIGAMRLAVQNDKCLIACMQEVKRFREAEIEAGAEQACNFVDIRDAASWSSEAANATPKIVGLLAAAAVEGRAPEYIDRHCAGRTLVYGNSQTAMDAALRLAERLDVTLVLAPEAHVLLPSYRDFPIHTGSFRNAIGVIGSFDVAFNELGEVAPWACSVQDAFSSERQRTLEFDLILDLSDQTPWFPDYSRRIGYARPDSRRPEMVERALFDLSGLVGTISRQRYVSLEPSLCAHSASGQTGCTRCLSTCPTTAISSLDGVIQIDANVCGGCGSCSAICPTGAMTYVAPDQSVTRRRIAALVSAYTAAGGEMPVLLLHTSGSGGAMIAALARIGQGLPANVLPLELRHSTKLGIAEFTTALSFGALRCIVQIDPVHLEEAGALRAQVDLANSIYYGAGLGQDRVALFDGADPESLMAEASRAIGEPVVLTQRLDLNAGANEIVRMAFAGATPDQIVALPQGAQFGRVKVDDKCTVCLACTRACPTGALEGRTVPPALLFDESRCVQCGLCARICPERAVWLEPRFAIVQAREPVVLKTDEPADCPNCGIRFGSKLALNGVITRLEGAGWSRQNEELARRLRLCETCRIQ